METSRLQILMPVELIDKSVTKVWNDNNNQDESDLRSQSQLYANDKAVGESHIKRQICGHGFVGLAKFDGGKEITYTIKSRCSR